jgi:hypothetical protein
MHSSYIIIIIIIINNFRRLYLWILEISYPLGAQKKQRYVTYTINEMKSFLPSGFSRIKECLRKMLIRKVILQTTYAHVGHAVA